MNAFHFSEKINLIHSQSEAGILRMLQNARFFGSAAVETAVLKFHITHSDGLQQSASNPRVLWNSFLSANRNFCETVGKKEKNVRLYPNRE